MRGHPGCNVIVSPHVRAPQSRRVIDGRPQNQVTSKLRLIIPTETRNRHDSYLAAIVAVRTRHNVLVRGAVRVSKRDSLARKNPLASWNFVRL